MATFSTTEELLYLVNVQTPSERVKIQFFPNELPFERMPKVNDIDIIGRNNPLNHYTGGATSFNLTLDFYGESDDLKDVMQRINMVLSWTYNEKGKGIPTIKVIWGDLFKDEVWVIKKCSYRLLQFDKRNAAMPRQAYMDLTFSLDTNNDKKAGDIRERY